MSINTDILYGTDSTMSMSLAEYSPELVAEIEAAGWKVWEYDDCIELERHSPLGEDFTITLYGDYAENAREQAEDFDAEEHAAEWYNIAHSGDTHGCPTSSLKDLLEDAEDIQGMLTELARIFAEHC